MRFFSEELNNPPSVFEKIELNCPVKSVLIHCLNNRNIRISIEQSKHLTFFLVLRCNSEISYAHFVQKKTSLSWRKIVTSRDEINRTEMRLLDVSHCPIIKAGIKKNVFLELSYSTSLKFTLETSFKKFKIFVLEEYVFVYRNRAIEIAPFQFSPL